MRSVPLQTAALLLTLSVAEFAGAEAIDFSAQQMTVEEERLELSGDVRLRYDRFGLRAERLRIERTQDGLRLEGPARLRACPCDEAPVELEFNRAELDSDGALTLYGPRLVSGDVPLFYWPQLSLASPDSVGLLPPRVDYRGPDGLFLGLGVEGPLSRSSSRQGALLGLGGHSNDTRARVGVGGYTRFRQVADGARVDLDVSGPLGRSALAWETLDGGMLDIDAHGAYAPGAGADSMRPRGDDVAGGGGLAWRVDALRGARGLRAPGSLIRVAMPVDRARFVMRYAGAPVLGYAQLRADATRGSPGLDDAQAGAAVGASGSQRLLPGLTLRLSSDVLGLSADQRSADVEAVTAALGVWAQRAELEAATALGPLSVRSGLSALGEVSSVNDPVAVAPAAAPRSLVQGATRLSAALPLARRFGAVRHVVAPQLSGELVLGVAPTAQAEAALLQRLGGEQAGFAVELNAALGAARRLDTDDSDAAAAPGPPPPAGSLKYIHAEMLLSSRWVAARLWGIARDAQSSSRVSADEPASPTDDLQWAAISWLRVGREAGAQVQLTLAEQSVDDWDERRVSPQNTGAAGSTSRPGGGTSNNAGPGGGLRPEAWSAPLSLAGSSGYTQLVLPFNSRFALQLASAWDLTALAAREESMGLLSGALAGGYRHPCGCLSARAEISHRLGRHPALAQAELGSFSQLFDASIQLSLFE